MAKKTSSTSSLSYQVSEIKSSMNDLQKKIKDLGAEGESVVKIFSELGDKIKGGVGGAEDVIDQIKESKAAILDFVEAKKKKAILQMR